MRQYDDIFDTIVQLKQADYINVDCRSKERELIRCLTFVCIMCSDAATNMDYHVSFSQRQ